MSHSIHCYHIDREAPGNPGAVVMRCCSCLRALLVPKEHARDYGSGMTHEPVESLGTFYEAEPCLPLEVKP